MVSYAAIAGARFRTLLQYRAAAAAGIGTQLFWGLIRMMIFEAFYRSTTAPQPMALRDVVTYIWLGQAMLGIQPWNADADIRQMIRTGTVAYEMLRPLDLYNLWYSRAVALRTAPTLLRSVPIFLMALLFFGMQPPPSWAAAAGWILTTLGAVLLSAAFTNLISISLLWTISGEGATRLIFVMVLLFSGMIVPLPLFPDWAQAALNFLPFRGLVDVPFRVWTGHIPAGQIGFAFAHQVAWTVALILLGRWILARGTRRLVIQGG
jgi:ABC-2 type transport system permease protein